MLNTYVVVINCDDINVLYIYTYSRNLLHKNVLYTSI